MNSAEFFDAIAKEEEKQTAMLGQILDRILENRADLLKLEKILEATKAKTAEMQKVLDGLGEKSA